MKNTMKKIAAVVMAVAMVLCFAACTGSNEGSSKEILIGATGPLTGGAASYGNSVKNGAELAIAEINAAGTKNGLTFKFQILDDEADAEKAASGYDTLISSGMKVSIGSVTSGSAEAFAKRAKEDQVFFMTPSASAASVIATGDNIFRVCFGDPQQGELAAAELVKTYKKIGCIYDTSDTYSAGIYEAFEAEMKKLNTAYEVRTFDADNKTDFTAQVEGLKDCEVIFLPIYYTEAGLIARTCTSKGLENIVLFGCDGLDGVAAEIDDTVKNAISYITPFDVNASTSVTVNFVKKYTEKYGAAPDQFAADGYDAVYAVVKAIEAADVKDAKISAADLCKDIVKVITSDSFQMEGATGVMSWDTTGSCNKVPVIVSVQ